MGDHHYVDKVEAFDVATDGACKADRPKGMKDKKWHPTDCSQLTTATAHPLKKPAPFKNAWMRCPEGLCRSVCFFACSSEFSWRAFFATPFFPSPPFSFPSPPCMLHVDVLRRNASNKAAVANRRCACIGRC